MLVPIKVKYNPQHTKPSLQTRCFLLGSATWNCFYNQLYFRALPQGRAGNMLREQTTIKWNPYDTTVPWSARCGAGLNSAEVFSINTLLHLPGFLVSYITLLWGWGLKDFLNEAVKRSHRYLGPIEIYFYWLWVKSQLTSVLNDQQDWVQFMQAYGWLA